MRKNLQIVALSLMGALGLFFGLFIIGETMSDPGGWRGLGLVALWLVPLLAVVAMAWLRPEWAKWLLAVLTAAVTGLLLWSVLAPQPWSDFENRNGPILAVAVFALAIPLTALGWRQPMPAGSMLLVLGLTPVASLLLLAATGGVHRDGVGIPPQAGLVVLTVPLVVVGALLVIAGLSDGGAKPLPPATPPTARLGGSAKVGP
jgi:hypothetical protein